MTIYLTKTENDKVYHFRATLKLTGVDIVQGVFYEWIGQYWQGCGDRESAIARRNELVEEKIKEGYQVIDFIEMPENTLLAYDKAEWHMAGDFPKDADQFQAYVHTGMFLGWCIDNDLVSDRFKDDLANEIEHFRQKKLTGSQIFQRCCDGVLTLEDLNETGNRFAMAYFELDKGPYLIDYEQTLAQNLPSIYHVEDTWDNYEKLTKVINERYAAWNR